MEDYKKILEEWKTSLSNYPKIEFIEARKLYIEVSNCDDDKLKAKLRNNLILNTLYVVLEFIENYGLIYLHSYSYDMSDIINVCNEIWINKIDSGALLNVKNFREMFDSEFYNKLSEGLNITQNILNENPIFDIKTFMDLLIDYIRLKDEDIDFNYNKLIEYMKTNVKYQSILYRIFYYEDNTNFCELFDGIIESFELTDDDLKTSKTKLKKLKYIIISNGLEYLRRDISRVIYSDSADVWVNKHCEKQIMKIIFQGDRLNDIQKDILAKRFGFLDGKRRSLDEVACDYNVTKERIRQREAKALRMLRFPTTAKKIKELM